MVSQKLLAGIGIATALLAVVIFLPKLSFIQPSGSNVTGADRAKAESDLRGHLLQALGGLVLGVGAYFTWRTFALNREGQITERFTRAVEQLANDDKLDIRLGGIFALERIAHDSETHYEPVLEVLTAFLRESARRRPESAAGAQSSAWAPSARDEVPDLRTDVQAAATVLGRRDRRHERPDYSLDLRGVDLRKASLSRAHLEDANLEGAHLEWASLVGARLHGAILFGAHLERADLGGADLERAILNEAHLESANLSAANLEWTFLSDAHLEGANLDLARMELALLDRANLAGAILSRVSGLTQSQLAEAFTDDSTQVPDDLRGEAAE